MFVAQATAGPAYKQKESRPQALAAIVAYVLDNFDDATVAALQSLREDVFDLL
jgi:hypothetical protein